jgi:hypothetical protein
VIGCSRHHATRVAPSVSDALLVLGSVDDAGAAPLRRKAVSSPRDSASSSGDPVATASMAAPSDARKHEKYGGEFGFPRRRYQGSSRTCRKTKAAPGPRERTSPPPRRRLRFISPCTGQRLQGHRAHGGRRSGAGISRRWEVHRPAERHLRLRPSAARARRARGIGLDGDDRCSCADEPRPGCGGPG